MVNLAAKYCRMSFAEKKEEANYYLPDNADKLEFLHKNMLLLHFNHNNLNA